MRKRLAIEKVKSRLPSYITIKEDTYINCSKKATFIDNEYGEWITDVGSVFKGESHHPERRKTFQHHNKLTLMQIKSRLHPKIKIKEDTYINTRSKATFIDEDFGEFISTVGNVIQKKSRHQKYTIDALAESKTLNIDEVRNRLPQYVTIIESTYTISSKKSKFIDEQYGEFEAYVNNVLQNQSRHPKANYRNSKGQNQVQEWIESLGYKTITSPKIPNSQKEIDIYIPELKLGIEYNGLYWHSGPKEELRMLNKKLLAEENGIKILHIWDYEWLKNQIKTKLIIQKELGI